MMREARSPGLQNDIASEAVCLQAPPGLPKEALAPLLAFILRQSGLAAEGYQAKPLNRRFSACLRALKAPSEAAGLMALERKSELVGVSLSALLIGVSGFFRDAAVFDHLRQWVLPQALANKGVLRVYSAGCSAGHELYSVAMILDEIGGLEVSHLLGVDCRHDAIDQARTGAFAISDVKDLGETRQQRYFRLEGGRALISSRLREKPAWRVADFGVFRDAQAWDLILFRNVAIYLEADYAHRVWHWLDQQLKPGGFVVIGSAERPPEDLRWRREATCIYRKPFALCS